MIVTYRDKEEGCCYCGACPEYIELYDVKSPWILLDLDKLFQWTRKPVVHTLPDWRALVWGGTPAYLVHAKRHFGWYIFQSV
ncbi:Uncharacterized protein HZ326_31352 [Fusarium oxysporum f. sp. albedinis]|nr:Uncharacterized protein HZ326_31352 [Fusarium oxysporum f. sp. albedinis]